MGFCIDASSLPGGNTGGNSGGEGTGIDYSLEEQFTGKHWIDGKKIYQKTVNFGQLPAVNTYKYVSHDVSNLEQMISMTGIATSPGATTLYFPERTSSLSHNISKNQLAFYGDINWHLYTTSYVTIQYTCTDR